MALSKKLRFEVFKRDGFTCQYCGRKPPEIILEVDHMEAASSGGSDKIDNLITSCFDCNRGKSATPLEQLPSSVELRMRIQEERQKQLQHYNTFVRKIDKQRERDVAEVMTIFEKSSFAMNSEHDKLQIRRFVEKLPIDEVKDAMRLAVIRIPENPNRIWKYFCGICWRKVRGEKPPWERNG